MRCEGLGTLQSTRPREAVWRTCGKGERSITIFIDLEDLKSKRKRTRKSRKPKTLAEASFEADFLSPMAVDRLIPAIYAHYSEHEIRRFATAHSEHQ